MKNEQQLLYKVMRNFEGMQKIEAFDILHKIEVLLFYAKSPLNNTQVKKIIQSDGEISAEIDPFQFTILPNGNFCEFIGSNDWIHIYKEIRRGLGRLYPFPSYYFKTKYAPLELRKLTEKQLLENVCNSPHEMSIQNFLKKNRLQKRDPATRKLVLLRVSTELEVES